MLGCSQVIHQRLSSSACALQSSSPTANVHVSLHPQSRQLSKLVSQHQDRVLVHSSNTSSISVARCRRQCLLNLLLITPLLLASSIAMKRSPASSACLERCATVQATARCPRRSSHRVVLVSCRAYSFFLRSDRRVACLGLM